VTGYTKDEFIGTAVHDLVHPVHPDGSPYPAQDCPLHTALGFGDTLRGHEDVFLHKDGRLFPVRCNAQPVIRNGEPIAVVIEFWDITREKHADERLQKKNERLRLISDAAAVLLTASDPDTMMQELFTRVRDHLGVDAYFNFVADESTGALHLVSCAGIPRLAAESITHDFEHALYETIGGTPLGQIAPVHISNLDRADGPAIALVRRLGFRTYACSPLVYDDRLIGTLSFASHERTSLDPDDLAFLGTLSRYVTFAYVRLRLVERLREADRRKDEFLATLAHELRNPLAPIRHGLQVIRRSGIDDPLVDVARTTMERQLEQMVRLVDDLLDVSRITRNRLAIRKRPIALKDAIESAIETTQPLIDEARHSFSVELPPETILVDADPTRLAQVFANLLNNAAKYTEPGGEISLRAWIEGNEVVTSVKDTGIGIAREHLPKLFQMFSQVVPALERSRGGLGIGLS
ncbi:MAG TPA: ATP-binding protein, partial [Planctomycetota bacterium]|nr:ATP-binding protein [Planctomycetota bacterium]